MISMSEQSEDELLLVPRSLLGHSLLEGQAVPLIEYVLDLRQVPLRPRHHHPCECILICSALVNGITQNLLKVLLGGLEASNGNLERSHKILVLIRSQDLGTHQAVSMPSDHAKLGMKIKRF